MAKVRLPEEYPDNSEMKVVVVTTDDEGHVNGYLDENGNMTPGTLVNTEGLKSSKEPEKVEKKEPQAMVKKKSLGKKMSESLFPKEDRKEIGDVIIFDYIIPGAKEIIQNVITNSVEMLLFGGSSGRSSRTGQSVGRTNYRGMSSSNRRGSKYSRDDDSRSSRRDCERVDLDDILFYSYTKADKAWQTLLDYIDEYGSCKVRDLYDTAGITPPSDWTVDAYGWDELSPRAAISPVRTRDEDGRLVTMYCLDLPSPYRIRG